MSVLVPFPEMQLVTHHIPVTRDSWEVRRIDKYDEKAGKTEQVTCCRCRIAIEVSRTTGGSRRDRGLAIGLSGIEQLAGLCTSQQDCTWMKGYMTSYAVPSARASIKATLQSGIADGVQKSVHPRLSGGHRRAAASDCTDMASSDGKRDDEHNKTREHRVHLDPDVGRS